jgi:hypothetical protein
MAAVGEVVLFSRLVDPKSFCLNSRNELNAMTLEKEFGLSHGTVSLQLQARDGTSDGTQSELFFSLLEDEEHNMEVLPGRTYFVSGVLEDVSSLTFSALRNINKTSHENQQASGGGGGGGGGDSSSSSIATLVDTIPSHIDGNVDYIIDNSSLPDKRWQQLKLFADCRPWGRGMTTSSVEFPTHNGYMYSCEGGYICLNKLCPCKQTDAGNKGTTRFFNKIIPDSGGKIAVYCSICEKNLVRKIPCQCTKKLWRESKSTLVIVQHHGKHQPSCVSSIKFDKAISPATQTRLQSLARFGLSPIVAKAKVLDEVYQEALIGEATFHSVEKTAMELGQDRAVQALIAGASAGASAGAGAGAGAGVSNATSKLISILQWKQQLIVNNQPYLRKFNTPELNHMAPEYYFTMTTYQVKLAATIGVGQKYSRDTTMVHFDIKHNVIKSFKTMGAHYMDKTYQRVQTIAIMHCRTEDAEVMEIFWKAIIEVVKLECNSNFQPGSLMADNAGANWQSIRSVYDANVLERSCEFHYKQSVRSYTIFQLSWLTMTNTKN